MREGYLQMAAREPKRWVLIDAAQSVEAIQASIRTAVEERLTVRVVAEGVQQDETDYGDC